MGGDVVVKVSVDWVRWRWFLILTPARGHNTGRTMETR